MKAGVKKGRRWIGTVNRERAARRVFPPGSKGKKPETVELVIDSEEGFTSGES